MYHVRMQPAHISVIAFLAIVCMYIDSLHVSPLIQLIPGYMALPTGAKQ